MRFNIATLIFACALSAQAQGSFQNLNFEQANPIIVQGSPYYPYMVTAASAFPHWTVTIGGVQQDQVTQNDPATGSTWVTLIGPGSASGFSPLDGNYSVLLQGGGTASDASISQTGLIPAGTQTLLFDFSGNQNDLRVTVGGQVVPTFAVGPGLEYGANISAWSGQNEQLTFSALEDFSESGNLLIDDISFSPNAVPEPSPFILTGIGGLFFAARRWCWKR